MMFPKNILAAYSILMLLFLAFGNQGKANGEELRFPTVGVSFVVPKGVVSSLDGPQGRLAVLTPEGQSMQTSSFLIVLEFAPRMQRDLRVYSDGIAAKIKGKVSETKVNGDVAYELTSIAKLEKRGPKRAQIVEKDGYFFVMLLHSSVRNEGNEEFNEVCSSMRWSDRELPSENLKLEVSRSVLSETIKLKLPRILRDYPIKDARVEAAFGLSNYRDGHEEFFLQAALIQADKEKELGQIVVDFEKNVATRLKLRESLVWKAKNPERSIMSSNLFEAEIQVPGGPKLIHKMVYCMVRLSPEEIAFVQFGITDALESAVEAYAKCIDEIIDSIEISDER